jgi:hypothetical protein
MRVEYYVQKKVRSDLIYGIAVYMASVPKECENCVYFPCEEKCKVRRNEQG